MSSWAPRGLQTGLLLQVGGLLGGAFQPGLQLSSWLTKGSRELKKTLVTPISSPLPVRLRAAWPKDGLARWSQLGRKGLGQGTRPW